MPKTAAPASPDAAARDAANATRRADVKKMMSERAEAKKVSDAAAAAKKAESDKAMRAAMEARRAKRPARPSAPAKPDAAAIAAARAAAIARMAERAKAAPAPVSKKSIMGRFRAPVKAPATSPQNTGPENVGARPVPMARYKKGGSVSCKTY
jgi:hypothetical protein